MPFVSTRDLQRHAGRIVDEAASSGRPAVITRSGKPVAILTAVDEEAFEDFVIVSQMGVVDDVIEALTRPRDELSKAVEAIAAIRAQ